MIKGFVKSMHTAQVKVDRTGLTLGYANFGEGNASTWKICKKIFYDIFI